MSTNEKVNILLVDDQPAKLLSYEVILSELGENLIKASSGREALEQLLKTDIAVVLMDVSMPELDGFELAEMIRQHPRYQRTAIIFVSAVHLTDLDRLMGYQRGAVDYMSVPVIPEILRAKVSVFAELYRKTQQLERLNRDLEQRVAERTAALEASTTQLRESEERFRRASDATGALVYDVDLREQREAIVHGLKRVVGLDPADMLLTSGWWHSRIHPEDLPGYLKNLDRHLRDGEVYRAKYRVRHADGLWLNVEDTAQVIRDAEGLPIRLVGAVVDVTQRKRAEEGQHLLAEVSRLLMTSLGVDDRLEAVAGLVVEGLADWCAVNLVTEDKAIRLVAADHHEPEKTALIYQLARRYPLDLEEITGTPQILRAKQAVCYTHFFEALPMKYAQDQAYRQLLDKLGSQSTIIAPLVVWGQALGVLTLVRAESERPFDEADLALAEELAYRAATAVDNARLYEAERAARIEAEAAQQSLTHLAQMRERNRLAHELHDNVAQALGYLNLKMTTTHDLLAANRLSEVSANLRELKQITKETYADIRSEIFNLRGAPLMPVNFLDTLSQYVEKYKRFYSLDIQLIFEVDETFFDFPTEVSIAFIRIIQEALMNVRKHARVDHAGIRLGRTASDWCISIEDAGRGFDLNAITTEQTISYGIKIMRERIEGVGGRLEIESAPGQGTRVTLFYPQE